MKRHFLSPFFAPLTTFIVLLTCIVIAYLVRFCFGHYNPDEHPVLEILTYGCYIFSFITLFCVANDHVYSSHKRTFWAISLLWVAILFREMGAQHWLTRHDTTAIKMRFFTNPANPLHEKIITATILFFLVTIALYLAIKYFRVLVIGFFKRDPICWTIATFGTLGSLTQFADRFPSEYTKKTGERLPESIIFFTKFFEESGEALLPLLFAVAFWQAHLLIARDKDA